MILRNAKILKSDTICKPKSSTCKKEANFLVKKFIVKLKQQTKIYFLLLLLILMDANFKSYK